MKKMPHYEFLFPKLWTKKERNCYSYWKSVCLNYVTEYKTANLIFVFNIFYCLPVFSQLILNWQLRTSYHQVSYSGCFNKTGKHTGLYCKMKCQIFFFFIVWWRKRTTKCTFEFRLNGFTWLMITPYTLNKLSPFLISYAFFPCLLWTTMICISSNLSAKLVMCADHTTLVNLTKSMKNEGRRQVLSSRHSVTLQGNFHLGSGAADAPFETVAQHLKSLFLEAMLLSHLYNSIWLKSYLKDILLYYKNMIWT